MKKTLFLSIALALVLSGCSFINSQNSPSNPKESTNNTTAEEPKTKQSKNILDLSNQQLTKIPDYVFKLTSLEELNVSNNQLTGAIQAEIRQLKNLKILNASNNLMTGVPAEVGRLQNLQILNLSNNQLTGLPNELGNLKNLKTLDISGNNYSTLDLSDIEKNLPTSVNIIKNK